MMIIDYYFGTEVAKKKSVRKDISFLENVLSKGDFGEIIESSELFWQAFCKSFSQIDSKEYDLFYVSLQERTLIISGKEHIISDVQKFVEKMRKLFLKGHAEKSGFMILPIEIRSKYFIRGKADTIDLINCLSSKQFGLYESFFRAFIRPTMKKFCKSIGTVCSDIDVSQKILVDEVFGVKTAKIEAFKIDWISGTHFGSVQK